MHLSQSLTLSLRQTQRLELSQRQRLSLENSLLTRRFELMQVLYGERFTPTGVCPECGYTLDGVEILRGFKDDPQDFTTGCPECERRFHPKLRSVDQFGSVEVGFLCPSQTLGALAELQALRPGEIQKEHARVFYSARAHFGTLGGAFQKLGIEYQFSRFWDNDDEWRDRVESFFGKLPDTTIAQCVGVSTSTVSKMRRELGIEAFSKRKVAEELFG